MQLVAKSGDNRSLGVDRLCDRYPILSSRRLTLLERWEVYGGVWAEWENFIESWLHDATRKMVSLSNIAIGGKALHLGAGAGGEIEASLKAVGAAGSVVCSDFSQTMTMISARKFSHHRHSNVTVITTPAENLPFDRASFDVVFSRLAIFFFADLDAALSEQHRVLKDGGKSVSLVYNSAERCPIFDIPTEQIKNYVDLSIYRELCSVFSLSPNVLEKRYKAFGFSDVKSEIFSTQMKFRSKIELIDYVMAPFGIFRFFVDGLPIELKEAYLMKLSECFEIYRGVCGSFTLPCEVRMVSAGKRK